MVDALIIGTSLGCIYAMVAVGFSLIYRTTGILNFAQGSFVMVGAMVPAVLLDTGTVHSAPVAFALGIGMSMVLGVLLAVSVVFPLWKREASPFVVILGTLLFLTLTENIVFNIVGSNPRTLPGAAGFVTVLGQRISLQIVVTVIVTMSLAFGLSLFVRRTRLGRAMLACSVSRDDARLMGISPVGVGFLAIVLAAAVGGIGGLLIAPLQFTSFSVGLHYNLSGFLAAVIGGLGDIRGAVIGGLVVGIAEALLGIYVSTALLQFMLALSLLAILFFRPSGLLTAGADH